MQKIERETRAENAKVVAKSMGIGQIEQTKIAIGQTVGATQNFFQILDLGRTGHPCPRPKSVWPIPVLGRGPHPGKTFSSDEKPLSNLHKRREN